MSDPKFDIVADGFSFLECPRWHGDRLWMSDMVGGAIYTMTAAGTVEKVIDFPSRPAGLTFLSDDTLVMASMKERALYRLDQTRQLKPYADLSTLATGPLNDSVIDRHGNIFVGHFGFDMEGGEAPKPASVIKVDAKGEAFVAADEMMFPNGSVITPDGKTLICAETFANRLTAFDLAADGTLSGRRVWADLGEEMPDGICLDASGAIWVSSIGPGVFLRVAEGGEILQRIRPNAKRAVACCLGGKNGQTLFAMTFEGELEDIWSGIRAAQIETIRVDVPGAQFN
ncbi:MAG: SMP-30/gluconolactonase/LRE family protein [Pseudomonadota bacterium]